MKRISLFIMAVIAVCVTGSVSAQVPGIINYQGRVTVAGTNFTGTGYFQFALVNNTGTATFWQNGTGAVAVAVSKGLYSVLLGGAGMFPIPAAVFTNADVRLRVWFNDGVSGLQLLSPDQRLGASGYALVAKELDATGDLRGLRLNIGGGHTLSGTLATIAGGTNHTASGNYAAIGGGYGNTASGGDTTVGGGLWNAAMGEYDTVAGGYLNTALGFFCAIGGGQGNTASGQDATVGGGFGNTASGMESTVAGGVGNMATNDYAMVAGGWYNIASGYGAFVGGGGHDGYESGGNFAGHAATVGGGIKNIAGAYRATVGGGYGNQAHGHSSFIGGGFSNSITSYAGTIGGGENNRALDQLATVGGGRGNRASAINAVVGGGDDNRATNVVSTVAGGGGNVAGGERASVGGGAYNQAIGFGATVPGGQNNTASGYYSFAVGRRAKAIHDGAFVWGDSTAADISSTAADQFTARCAGGIRFYSDSAASLGVELLSNDTAWSILSDRSVKENIEPVSVREILERLVAMPVTRWSYKDDPGQRRYIGPMAQDFHAAFALGDDDKRINTLDTDGVTMAAIKGLYEVVQEKDAAIAKLQSQNADLEKRLERMEKQMQAVSHELSELQTAPQPAVNARSNGGM